MIEALAVLIMIASLGAMFLGYLFMNRRDDARYAQRQADIKEGEERYEAQKALSAARRARIPLAERIKDMRFTDVGFKHHNNLMPIIE